MSTNNTDILITYDSTTTTMSIDLSGLAPATYTGSVAYTDTSGKSTTATVALTISQSTPTPPPPPPVESGNPYGGGWIGGYPSQENLYPVLVKSKAKHFRYQIQWDKIETAQGVYDWSKVDDFVHVAKSNNLLPTFVIQNAPVWNQVVLIGNPGKSIPDPTKIGAFCTALLSHYPAGTFYSLEVNNEGYSTQNPNLQMFSQQLIPSLQACRDSIKAHSPTTLLGGPAELTNDTLAVIAWWGYFYQAGCHHLCDYLNFHFYPGGSPDQVSAGKDTLTQRIKAITDMQAQYHDVSRPIWLTETGWKRLNSAGTNGGVPDAILAGYIKTLLSECMASGAVQKVFYFDLGSLAPGSGASQNFGLQCFAAWEGFIAAHPQW